MAFRAVRSRIPELMRERNLEPIDVYSDLKMKKQQYSRYTNTTTIMSLPVAMMIADYFGVSIEELYDWEEY